MAAVVFCEYAPTVNHLGTEEMPVTELGIDVL